MKPRKRNRFLFLSILLTFGLQIPVLAHVKWFSRFSYTEAPLTLGEIFTPLFLTLLGASLGAISVLVFVDDHIARLDWYQAFNKRLDRYASKSDLIIRVATGAVLLLSWQAGALLVPELQIYNTWIEFIQLTLAILILSNRFIRQTGYGLIGLYIFAFFKFGSIHLLDYVYLLGAGYYLTVATSESKKLRASALPALYASVGFSLCWVALEKVVYPGWAIQILELHPFLTMGFDHTLFLQMAAIVEFSLGFLLIVCLLQRPIALAITLLFFSTTLVFGKLEFVGHAIVHAALIVFLLQGPGETFRTPITFFKRINQRIIFAMAGYTVVFLSMILIYTNTANRQYLIAQAQQQQKQAMHHSGIVEISSIENQPQMQLKVTEDVYGGWNVNLDISNFTFSPEDCGKAHVDGHGHAHLYINNEKVARLYSPWYHLSDLPPGKHEIKVVLTSNDHNEYVSHGVPLASSTELVVM